MKYFTLFSLKLSLPSSCEIVSILNNRRSFDNLFILRKINHSQPKMQELSGTSITINTQTGTTRLSDLNKTLTSRATSTSSNVIPKCLSVLLWRNASTQRENYRRELKFTRKLFTSWMCGDFSITIKKGSKKEGEERRIKGREGRSERGEGEFGRLPHPVDQ